jgi:hypothetical protein
MFLKLEVRDKKVKINRVKTYLTLTEICPTPDQKSVMRD